MAKLAQIPAGGVVLDPMCGGGTILNEIATKFEVSLNYDARWGKLFCMPIFSLATQMLTLHVGNNY